MVNIVHLLTAQKQEQLICVLINVVSKFLHSHFHILLWLIRLNKKVYQKSFILIDWIVVLSSTCNDGILNNGETGIDCGGKCAACASCNDEAQNQGETGVDCGGPCPACGKETTIFLYGQRCLIIFIFNSNNKAF